MAHMSLEKPNVWFFVCWVKVAGMELKKRAAAMSQPTRGNTVIFWLLTVFSMNQQDESSWEVREMLWRWAAAITG